MRDNWTRPKHIDTLYTKLVKEYNAGNWSAICGLDRFLEIKRDAAYKAGHLDLYNNIIDVIWESQNDFY